MIDVRLTVGMTGATGAVLGLRLLEQLAELPEVETHLIPSRWARSTLELETGRSARELADLADVVHNPDDQGAAIASGSFRTDGMVIVPCSMKTLAGSRAGYADGQLSSKKPPMAAVAVGECRCQCAEASAPHPRRCTCTFTGCPHARFSPQ